MQYVRSIGGSVSKTWNSINPATLSGAIDVIVVEQEDGTLACSPFHVRFGKFSLLRPYEKKVEFYVNDVKQNFAMKLGEGGEAFFVFETTDNIPESMQTSPLVSPASSPPLVAENSCSSNLTEPDFLELDLVDGKSKLGSSMTSHTPAVDEANLEEKQQNMSTSLSASPEFTNERRPTGNWSSFSSGRPRSEEILPFYSRLASNELRKQHTNLLEFESLENCLDGPHTPSLPTKKAIDRARALSERLSASNIPSRVTGTGDLMLDMTGYKSTDEDTSHAEDIARKILAEELEVDYDIGALIDADEHGNLWIYSSEEAKEAANNSGSTHSTLKSDMASDPGYHSEGDSTISTPLARRTDFNTGLETPPKTPPETTEDSNRNYAKTLRLTSDQLKALGLKSGPNSMSFTVNRATCQAYMYLWRYDVPIVISDIDGTITKSDALGHVLNMIGRDWTHAGVAKLYTEIVNNGYNIMYLTSRSVGQADTTRAYLNGVIQESYHLPKGPTIMSPDRTIAALRRELYIRKPEVFKMACLRDIKSLFGHNRTPFYAGFGNRFTDALSYRSVSIPSNRIFTINSHAEVSLDLLSLKKLRYSYVNMREVVDHYFPPLNMLVNSGGEDYTDFTYWREPLLDIQDYSDSECDERDEDEDADADEDDDDDDEIPDEMVESFVSRNSIDEASENFHQPEEKILSKFLHENQNDLVISSFNGDHGSISGVVSLSETQGQLNIRASNEHQVEVDIDAEAITGMKSLRLSDDEMIH